MVYNILFYIETIQTKQVNIIYGISLVVAFIIFSIILLYYSFINFPCMFDLYK